MTVVQRFCILHHLILLDHLSNVPSSHYALASLPDQFNTFIWIGGTRAVTPLEAVSATGTNDTWPFGERGPSCRMGRKRLEIRTSAHAGVSYVGSLVPA